MAKGTDYTLGITTRVKDHASKPLSRLGKTGRMAGKSIAAGFIKAQLAIAGMKIAVRGVINVIRGLTVDVAKQGDEFAKMSQKIGVSVEVLSGMKHAAELSGASFETLANGMGLLAKNAFDMSEAGGEAAIAFEQLGIEVMDSRGGLRSVEDLINDIADALSEMEKGSLKTALAQKLFGRSGKELIPLLNAGADGIREMREEAEQLGIIWTGPQTKAAESFTDALDRFNKSIKGIKETIGKNLLLPLAEGFESLAKTIAANRKAIVGFVTDVIGKLVPALIEAAGFAEKAFLRMKRLKEGLTLEGAGKQGFLDFVKSMGLDDERMRMGADRSIDAIEAAIDARTKSIIAKWQALFAPPGEGGSGVTTLEDTLVTAKKVSRTFLTELKNGANEATAALAGTKSQAMQLGATLMGSATTGLVGFFDVITQGTASASEAFEAMARDILRSLQRLAMNQLITQIFGAIFGAITPGLKTPVPTGDVPVMAKGGITTRETLAHLHPNEAVIPLDRLGSMGGGGGNNYFTINGGNQSPEEIANAVARKLRGNRGFRQTIRGAARSGL